MSDSEIDQAVEVLSRGGVIAYPTEAVYGLGCDAKNTLSVERLLQIKQRQQDKGLILIAANIEQLRPYLLDIDAALQEKVLASWPGPLTWLWPARPDVSRLLRGRHDTLAVRVTAHPVAAGLCQAFNAPIVSTSANISGQSAARTAEEVCRQFNDKLDFIITGEVGGADKPSEIRDVLSGKVIRQ